VKIFAENVKKVFTEKKMETYLALMAVARSITNSRNYPRRFGAKNAQAVRSK
jgi:hypothetical protein